MKSMKVFFWVTDVGFVLYWILTAFHLIPVEWAFKDYNNPIIMHWNWSFLPLDMLISLTGFGALYMARRNREMWRMLSVCSLVLTFCSGLQALSFWSLRQDFDLMWWGFNGYLMVYPLPFLYILMQSAHGHMSAEASLPGKAANRAN